MTARRLKTFKRHNMKNSESENIQHNVEAARPILRARSRMQGKESSHGSQATRGGYRVERAVLIGRRVSCGSRGRRLRRVRRAWLVCRGGRKVSENSSEDAGSGMCLEEMWPSFSSDSVRGRGVLGRKSGSVVVKSLAYR